VTRRRSSYRSLASLQRDARVCRACLEAGYPLESLPVLHGHEGQRAYMLGQAPGAVEGEERRPWRGRAGRTLRRWLAMDEDEFYATFYCASITRCYPGPSPGGRGDRTPTPREQELCAFWRDWELRLLRPALIVTVGGLAARRLLGLTRLGECVGQRFSYGDATAIALPHPSGASGWLNDPANRALVAEAAALVRAELARIGAAPAPAADRSAEAAANRHGSVTNA
jgi:uracil-DNA glycosylase family 4